MRKSHGIARIETLERRQLLSGYGYHQLATYTYLQLTTPVGMPVEDKAGDLFFLADIGETRQEAIFELAKGAATPSMFASFSTTLPPANSIAIDSSGDLFGTYGGGTTDDGQLWEIIAGSSTINPVASFTRATTGGSPGSSSMVVDSNGNVYGLALLGGANNGGTVWEYQQSTGSLIPVTALPQATAFGGSYGGISIDSQGDIFGTISESTPDNNYGTIWEVPASTRTYEVLGTFNGTNGNGPNNPLVIDATGNVFGDASQGGPTGKDGVGTLFEILSGSGTPTVVANFDGLNGFSPSDGLFTDSAGDLFGATALSGTTGDGKGTIFELAKNSTSIDTLYTGTDLYGSKLFMDSSGNLIEIDQGFIFELSPGGGGGGGGGGGTGSLSGTLGGAISGTTVIAGQKTNITQKLSITDSGTGPLTGTLKVSYYLSGSTSVGSSSIALPGSVSKHIKLKAGKGLNLVYHLKSIPANTPDGATYLVAQTTDPSGTVSDIASAATLNVVPPQVTLAGVFVKASPKVKPGGKFTVTFSLTNSGNVPAVGKLPVYVDLSTVNVDNQDLDLLPVTRPINIKPGKTAKVSATVSLLEEPAGIYHVYLRLDPLNALSNTNPLGYDFGSATAVLTIT